MSGEQSSGKLLTEVSASMVFDSLFRAKEVIICACM